MVRNAFGLGPELGAEFVRAGVGLGLQQVGREPQVTLPLVGLHQLADPLLEILEDFDFDGELVATDRW